MIPRKRRHRRRGRQPLSPLAELKPVGERSRKRWYVNGRWKGNLYVRGGYASEAEARAAATQLFAGCVDATWETVELNTTDLTRAKHILRDRDLGEGLTLPQVMRPRYGNVKGRN